MAHSYSLFGTMPSGSVNQSTNVAASVYQRLQGFTRRYTQPMTVEISGPLCMYCKRLGKPEAQYRCHYETDYANRIVCPVRKAACCPLCGDEGKDQRPHSYTQCQREKDILREMTREDQAGRKSEAGTKEYLICEALSKVRSEVGSDIPSFAELSRWRRSQLMCLFCEARGYSKAVHGTHKEKDIHGKIVCPVRLYTTCMNCGEAEVSKPAHDAECIFNKIVESEILVQSSKHTIRNGSESNGHCL